MRRFIGLIGRFGRDERGVFAVMFGLMAIVLIALGGAVVDYVSLEQTRNRAQIALDAAALALQAEVYEQTLTNDEIRSRAEALLINRVADASIHVEVESAETNEETGSIHLTARMTMPTIFVNLVGVSSLSARIVSEARRGSMDVEVAVAIDVTGSMNDRIRTGVGNATEPKIEALERAMGQLIDLVVKDEQEPSYSKMAIVPYSMGVNVGSYASTIRGPITPSTAITNINWFTGTVKTVSGAARSGSGQPVTITTSAAHGFSTNDFVYINNVGGTTQVNNKIYQITVTSTTKFTLNGTTTGTFSNYTSTGSVWKCITTTCEMVVTSAGHGLATGANAYIWGAGGVNTYSTNTSYTRVDNNTAFDNTAYNWINNSTSQTDYRFLVWKVGAVTANTFVLPGTTRTNGKSYGTYTSGGRVACVLAGCEYYLFINRYNNNPSSYRRHPISTCVTERATNTYTDASPATTYLGRNYPTSANPCLGDLIQPLTDDKDVLHALADDLTAVGSTAGHLGIAWGWYMVSPHFNGPWPAESQPAPADEQNVIRAVVLMTDGAFNTSYCNGVISQQSSSGSGDENSKINCNSPGNSNAFAQAEALCANIHASDPDLRVYTVAFDVGGIASAQSVMTNCASEPEYAFDASTGQDLEAAFASIGENLSYLRITQ